MSATIRASERASDRKGSKAGALLLGRFLGVVSMIMYALVVVPQLLDMSLDRELSKPAPFGHGTMGEFAAGVLPSGPPDAHTGSIPPGGPIEAHVWWAHPIMLVASVVSVVLLLRASRRSQSAGALLIATTGALMALGLPGLDSAVSTELIPFGIVAAVVGICLAVPPSRVSMDEALLVSRAVRSNSIARRG